MWKLFIISGDELYFLTDIRRKESLFTSLTNLISQQTLFFFFFFLLRFKYYLFILFFFLIIQNQPSPTTTFSNIKSSADFFLSYLLLLHHHNPHKRSNPTNRQTPKINLLQNHQTLEKSPNLKPTNPQFSLKKVALSVDVNDREGFVLSWSSWKSEIIAIGHRDSELVRSLRDLKFESPQALFKFLCLLCHEG